MSYSRLGVSCWALCEAGLVPPSSAAVGCTVRTYSASLPCPGSYQVLAGKVVACTAYGKCINFCGLCY